MLENNKSEALSIMICIKIQKQENEERRLGCGFPALEIFALMQARIHLTRVSRVRQ